MFVLSFFSYLTRNKLLIYDLDAGKWELKTNENKSKVFTVTEEEGIIYDEVKGNNKILQLELIKI